MRRKGGFTLLELLIAVLFFSAITVWVLYLNVMSLRAMQEIEMRFYIEKGVVEYQLEALRAEDASTLAVPSTVTFTTSLVNAADVSCNPEFRLSKILSAVIPPSVYTVTQPGPSPTLKQVTVTVNWRDPFGRVRTSTGTTLIGVSGLTDPGP